MTLDSLVRLIVKWLLIVAICTLLRVPALALVIVCIDIARGQLR